MIRTNKRSATGRSNARRRHWLASFAALALVLAACGGGEDNTNAASDDTASAAESADEQTEETGPTSTEATTTTVEETTTTEAEEPDAPENGVLNVEPMVVNDLDAGPASFSAAGGISLELPQPVTALTGQNCVTLLEADYAGTSPFEPGIAIGISAFLGRNELKPITTVDEWFAGYEGQPAPVSTGETITLLGEELEGYRIEGAFADAPTGEDSTLSCAVDADTVSEIQVFAAVYSDLFVAETDDGLLLAVANGFTEEEQIRARALLDAILPTVEADQSAAASEIEIVQVEPFNFEQRDAGVNQVDALGGLEFELPEAATVITSGNCVIVEYPGYTGSSPFPPNFGVSLAVSSGRPPGDLVPLSTIDGWLELYGDEPAPVATGETVTFLGEELQGYEVAGAFLTEPPAEQTVNCGSGPGIASDLSFITAPFGTEFIAETSDGLLSVGYGGFTEEENEVAREFFEQVFPTITAQ